MNRKILYHFRSRLRIIKQIFLLFAPALISVVSMAQAKDPLYRIAKIKVDPAYLERYTAALKEQMASAIKGEMGVLSYTAVADKSDPSQITILEVYADSAAYLSHISTPHFKTYKETVKKMVQSLELTEVKLLASAINKKE